MGLVKWKRSLVWLLASLAISAILWVLLLSTISERVVDKKWMETSGMYFYLTFVLLYLLRTKVPPFQSCDR